MPPGPAMKYVSCVFLYSRQYESASARTIRTNELVEVERVCVRAGDGVYLVELAGDDRQRVLRARALGPRLGFRSLADWIQPADDAPGRGYA